jgi:SAM-dependent methyltransferase
VDIIDSNLALARSRFGHLAPRLTFEARSVFDLKIPGQSFDLTVCRHVLQSIPQPRAAIAELARVTKPGGYLHFIAEDYGMIHFERSDRDLQALWHKVCDCFATASNLDLCVGRHIYRMLTEEHLDRVTINYIAVDPLRVPRDLIAGIFEGWRDGFAGVTAQYIGMPLADVLDHFNAMVAQARDPTCYVVWMVPVVSARIPVKR